MCETTVEESLILNFEHFTILYFFFCLSKKTKTNDKLGKLCKRDC